MVTLGDGAIGIPLKVSGADRVFLLELNAIHSNVYETLANELAMKHKPIPKGVTVQVGGVGTVQELALLPDLQIGALRGTDVPILLVPAPQTGAYAGVVAMDLLQDADVELDFAKNKLNLYSPKHCSGKVVYWADTYGTVPFRLEPTGRILLRMRLDDHSITASLSTTHAHSEMAVADALGFSAILPTGAHTYANQDQMTLAGKTPRGENIYHYPFKTLALGDLTINNPVIDLIAKPSAFFCSGEQLPAAANEKQICWGDSYLTIGLSVLKALHLYFAFDEKVLYITPAGAKKS